MNWKMEKKKSTTAKSSEEHKFYLNWLFQKLSPASCTHSKDHSDLIHILQYNQFSVFSLQQTKSTSVGKRKFSLIWKLKRILEIFGVTFEQLEKLLLSLWSVLVLKCTVINEISSTMHLDIILFYAPWTPHCPC